MKRIAITIAVLIAGLSFSSMPMYSQQANDAKDKMAEKLAEMKLEPDDKTLFKDESGTAITREEFYKFLKENSQTYSSQRVVKDGRVEEIQLHKLTPMEIELRKKMANVMSDAKIAKTESIGKPAALFTAKTLDGKSVSLADLKGKIVVLNFWFIACAPCVAEIPELNGIVDKYKSRDDVVFLAPASDDSEHLKEFLKKHEFKYQVIPSARDFDDKYKVSVFPTHIVIDRAGNIVSRDTGLGDETVKSVTSTIESLLAAPAK